MGHATLRRGEVAAFGQPFAGLVVVDEDGAAVAAGQVDHDIGLAFADARDDLGEQLGLEGILAGFGVADVAMDDGSALLGGLDGGCGDLLGRDGHMRALAGGIAAAGDGAGDDHLVVHLVHHWAPIQIVFMSGAIEASSALPCQ